MEIEGREGRPQQKISRGEEQSVGSQGHRGGNMEGRKKRKEKNEFPTSSWLLPQMGFGFASMPKLQSKDVLRSGDSRRPEPHAFKSILKNIKCLKKGLQQ